MKTPMSRFQIHDDLTAPEGSVPVLRGALATGGQLPNFLGVIAGSPAVLRAYARFRSELRHGRLRSPRSSGSRSPSPTTTIPQPGLALHSRTARAAGLELDDIALAREWDSRDEHEAALLRYLKAVVAEPRHARRCTSTRRRARRAGTTRRSSRRRVRVARGLHGHGSTSPARCRPTGPSRRPGSSRPRRPARSATLVAMGEEPPAARSTTRRLS